MKQLLIFLLLNYFRLAAKIQLLKVRPTIIGITGSAGKTSVMEAIACILEQNHTIKVSRKANSESGIPLNILDLSPRNFSMFDWLRLALITPLKLLTNWKKYEYYIVEMGIDGPHPPKNMGYLLSILTPHIGVFTSVGAMHSEPFDELVSETDPKLRQQLLVAAIAAEKGKLITSLPKDGLGVLASDYPDILNLESQTEAPTKTFGYADESDIKVKKTEWDKHGTRFTLDIKSTEFKLFFKDHVLPEHFGSSFAAAMLVAEHIGIPLEDSVKFLESQYQIPPGRATLIPGINDSTILDSSYNSSAQPLIDMLVMMTSLPSKRNIGLLGDIRELGTATQHEHERVAEVMKGILTEVVLVGPAMHQFVAPILKKAGVPVHLAESTSHAAEILSDLLKPQDLLLVKGSQNTLLLEIAIQKLMKEPEKAKQILCRRGQFWDTQRSKLTRQSLEK